MPNSDKIKYDAILSGYEEIDREWVYGYWDDRLPIMAVYCLWYVFMHDIISTYLYVIYGSYCATIGHIFLFSCRMCEVAAQGWQQPFPGATGWLPKLRPGDFSRNSLWLF